MERAAPTPVPARLLQLNPVTERFVTIQQSQRSQRNWRSRTVPPLYPWMKLAGRWIEHAGFAPGQRVRVAIEHGRLTITRE
ncbi:SymE family type I addiction module toxin [Paraburkholderia sp. J10-1]|uniref:SymE family type I addiction module toxin n=1 Tax=Paraburkholderia sp. J10-1 TaxID=2805430 RepID=UPI0039F14C7C